MSSSSSDSSSSPGASSSPSASSTSSSPLPVACKAKSRFRLRAFFLDLLQLCFFLACRLAAASAVASSPSGETKQKPRSSTALTDDLAKGRRVLCSETSRLFRRAWFSAESLSKAACSVATSISQKGPLEKSTLIASLIRSSSIETLAMRFGTSQTFGSMSASRRCGRKTLMLNVTTTNVCSVDFRFCHSRRVGPHAGLS
mmetsp:Transcript_98858/g.176102  ORF Transcript_98858/g.176102 Transcript_98858/m.176102 type:complete len:200 (-) Transcript_98858:987-1586(-)